MDKFLGLDIGTKTIGLATSDLLGMIATPLDTIRRTKFIKDMEYLKQVVQEHQITGFVLGLPVNMDGTEGARAQSTRAFARNLSEHFDAPIHFWDERLSTAAVERTMLEADISRQKRAQHVDKLAAAYILQGFLDAQRMNPPPASGGS